MGESNGEKDKSLDYILTGENVVSALVVTTSGKLGDFCSKKPEMRHTNIDSTMSTPDRENSMGKIHVF